MQPFGFQLNCSHLKPEDKISLIFTCEKGAKRILETCCGKLSV